MMKYFLLIFFSAVVFWSCQNTSGQKPAEIIPTNDIIFEKGTTIETRFNVPEGFKRTNEKPGSFAEYLRKLPLKPAGTFVKYHNGLFKTQSNVYDAVVDMEIGDKNLQQCADAVMRLRGEYLYASKQYDKIHFNFTNGFNVAYTEWMQGNRVVVEGNKTYWKKKHEGSNTYTDFRNYMDVIFTYAGTLSLSKELKSKNIKDINIGDVFIMGGSPGHAVIVVDMAENSKGEKLFLLAQSYMPAQETQVLKNLNDEKLSPWYAATFSGSLITPEWVFEEDNLKYFE